MATAYNHNQWSSWHFSGFYNSHGCSKLTKFWQWLSVILVHREFFLKGQSHFPEFFPGRKFPFWYTQNKFLWFWKVKSKKKKKVLSSFWNFSLLPFSISTFPFTIFLLFLSIFPSFPFFPCLFFPGGQQKFSGQKSLEGTLPPPPPVTQLLVQ